MAKSHSSPAVLKAHSSSQAQHSACWTWQHSRTSPQPTNVLSDSAVLLLLANLSHYHSLRIVCQINTAQQDQQPDCAPHHSRQGRTLHNVPGADAKGRQGLPARSQRRKVSCAVANSEHCGQHTTSSLCQLLCQWSCVLWLFRAPHPSSLQIHIHTHTQPLSACAPHCVCFCPCTQVCVCG